MLRRYEPVSCPHIAKLEHDMTYQSHMVRVHRMKYGVDTTPPEVSPRHRLIAQRAAERRKEFLKNARAAVRTSSRFTYGQAERGAPPPGVDPYASPLFPSRAPAVSPEDLNFLLSYGHNQSRSRLASARTSRVTTRAASRVGEGAGRGQGFHAGDSDLSESDDELL
jgi:hypothetical protein